MTSTKFDSPSTPGVQHDLTNFIVEAILINRHGRLPEACWRKGRPFAKEWGSLLTKVRRVKKLQVDFSQLAWFVQFYKIKDLDYAEFGLLRWKIKKYFKWCNVERFTKHYQSLHATLVKDSDEYVENTTTYKTKTQSTTSRKTLSDILRELENGSD